EVERELHRVGHVPVGRGRRHPRGRRLRWRRSGRRHRLSSLDKQVVRSQVEHALHQLGHVHLRQSGRRARFERAMMSRGALFVSAVLPLATPAFAEKATLTILHSFSGGDGSSPSGTLIAVGADLYGATETGGQWDRGTIFRISRSGAFTSLYAFQGQDDGA